MRLEVDKCCCYFDLRLGGIIIFIWEAVNALYTILSGFVNNIGSNLGNYGPIPNFIAGVIMIVVCVVGYIGIQKDKPNYLKPFMFYALLIILLVLVAVIGSIFFPSRFHASSIPVLLISAAILAYFVVCIHSLYKEMNGATIQPNFTTQKV